MKNLDLFQVPLPTFNLKAEESIKTSCGAAASMIIFVTLLLYGTIKTIQLIDKQNPSIAKYEQEVDFKQGDLFDFKSTNAKFAVSFQGFRDKNHKDDPRFVKWFVRLYGKKDGEYFEQHLPFHICTNEDYDGFYPINPQ